MTDYREPPRKPRMLASGMNWQNKFKIRWGTAEFTLVEIVR